MFQRALTKLAVNNSVRARRLYAAAAQPASRSTDWGP